MRFMDATLAFLLVVDNYHVVSLSPSSKLEPPGAGQESCFEDGDRRPSGQTAAPCRSGAAGSEVVGKDSGF